MTFSTTAAYLLTGGFVAGVWHKGCGHTGESAFIRCVASLALWPVVVAYFAGSAVVDRLMSDDEDA